MGSQAANDFLYYTYCCINNIRYVSIYMFITSILLLCLNAYTFQTTLSHFNLIRNLILRNSSNDCPMTLKKNRDLTPSPAEFLLEMVLWEKLISFLTDRSTMVILELGETVMCGDFWFFCLFVSICFWCVCSGPGWEWGALRNESLIFKNQVKTVSLTFRLNFISLWPWPPPTVLPSQ